MTQKKKTASTFHASPSAAAAHFAKEAKAAPAAPAKLEADHVAAVKAVFGLAPEDVLIPLHNAIESLQWAGDTFDAIADLIESGDTLKAKRMARMGRYLAEDASSCWDTSLEDMHTSMEAAKAGGAA